MRTRSIAWPGASCATESAATTPAAKVTSAAHRTEVTLADANGSPDPVRADLKHRRLASRGESPRQLNLDPVGSGDPVLAGRSEGPPAGSQREPRRRRASDPCACDKQP